jgi:hypothetical protein
MNAKVSVPTIARFEREETSMSTLGQAAVLSAFEHAGVNLTRADEVGYGGVSGRL